MAETMSRTRAERGEGRSGRNPLQPLQPLKIVELPLDQLARDPAQPRSAFPEAELAELAASIRARGVILPVLVSPHPDPAAWEATPYMLIAGERRWAAARLAGLATIPAVLREGPLDAGERLMMQLDENDGELRQELSLRDRAAAVRRAFELSGLEFKEQFAERHGKSRAWLSHLLRLARAEGHTRAALDEGHLAGMIAAVGFDKLPEGAQLRLLAAARATGQPITQPLVLAETAAAREVGAEAGAARTAREEIAAPRAAEDAVPPPPALREAQPSAQAGATSLPAASGRDRGDRESGRAEQGPPVHIVLSERHLEILLLLLGEEPRPTASEKVRQLFALLR